MWLEDPTPHTDRLTPAMGEYLGHQSSRVRVKIGGGGGNNQILVPYSVQSRHNPIPEQTPKKDPYKVQLVEHLTRGSGGQFKL